MSKYPSLLKPKKETSDPIAIKANTIHNFVTQRGWEMIKAAVACGELLAQKKAKVGHGRWERWMKENLDFTQMTATRYMKLFEHKDKIYEFQPDSLRTALHLIRGDKRITPGLISGDEKILRRNIVGPINTVNARLRRLPRDPIHYDSVMTIMDELMIALEKLLEDIS